MGSKNIITFRSDGNHFLTQSHSSYAGFSLSIYFRVPSAQSNQSRSFPKSFSKGETRKLRFILLLVEAEPKLQMNGPPSAKTSQGSYCPLPDCTFFVRSYQLDAFKEIPVAGNI